MNVNPISTATPRTFLLQSVTEGGALASALSTAALAWRGRREAGSAIATLNAPSHWLWGRKALDSDQPNLRYTALGVAVHCASAVMWAGLYTLLRQRRQAPTPVNAWVDAAAVTALAATVDLKLVPKRLTPGFEEHLSPRGLGWVYGTFGLGLAWAGMRALRR